eukprot:CAMPEP_0181226850 /NCGR_PEP_ID=MMETSP1096-20121128/32473_1 /TAXON_ID=156174 ORGANISM="Chrysochromulina ericina, Strain CCMP281" /NCGR_SAMPLE_ID=MMETSP1096 /ASSEMBLY_ACC=CAM_ASM_000453 /LENGTH=39 /DNA_ID= /DNA_START= /DNA_END= /DNA_ORIENTATION=
MKSCILRYDAEEGRGDCSAAALSAAALSAAALSAAALSA